MPEEKGKEKEQAQDQASEKEAPSTSDAIEAAEKEHEETQAEAMEDLLAEDGLAPAAKAPDQKPEDAKRKEQSAEQKDKGRSAEAKKEEGKAPEKTPEKEQKTKQDEPKAETPEKGDKPKGDLENMYEVKGPEGNRLVKASDLVNTYQQFSSLQQQHLSLKPLIELSRQAQVPLSQIFSYTVFGIKKAHEQAKGATTGPGASKETPPPGDTYAGPFASAEDDAYMKESDPKLHGSMWALFNQNQELKNAVNQFQGRLTARDNEKAVEQEKSVKEQLDDLMGNFAKAHEDYFGKEDTLANFKGFLGQKYADVNVSDIDLKFLNSVLMHFDPEYFATYFAEQAKTEKDKQREEERAAFGESGDVRSTTVTPQLTEQQEHMADML